MAKVACECAVTPGLVLVMGEITTDTYVDIAKLARKTIKEIGYTRAKYGFDGDTCGVIVTLDEQSIDIKGGVDDALGKAVGLPVVHPEAKDQEQDEAEGFGEAVRGCV